MNKAKKLLAICLCVSMICAMSVTAFAADAGDRPADYHVTHDPDARPADVIDAEDVTNGKGATVTDDTVNNTNVMPEEDKAAAEADAQKKIEEILDVAGAKNDTDVETKTRGVSLTPDEYTDTNTKDLDADEESNADKSGISPIMLETSGLYFSVTVPTVLPVYVNEQNQHFEAANVSIINNSYGPVKVTAAKVSVKNGWELATYDEKALDKEKVNTPKYGMMLDGVKVGTDGAVTLGTELAKVMEPVTTDGTAPSTVDTDNILTFGYQVKTAPQAEKIDRDNAATLGNVIFTLAWDAYVAPTEP